MSELTLVYLGPSLTLEKAKAIMPEAEFLPPIQCTDMIKAIARKPQKIIIIDGYFEQCAAVWHKEILLALEAGIEVYGASSMGALRAAELADFGMQGVGKVYEEFKCGELEDDDEVAVLHKPADEQFRCMTDAMVNVRASVQAAYNQEIIAQHLADHTIQEAKALFYKHRTFDNIFSAVIKQNGVDHQEIKAFQAWLKAGNYVDQKALDAKLVLEQARQTNRVDNVAVNKTLLLDRLVDEVHAEAFDLPPDTDKRFVLTLSYLLKTSQRLKPSIISSIQSKEDFEASCRSWIADTAFLRAFYCLCTLFELRLDDTVLLAQDDFNGFMRSVSQSSSLSAQEIKVLLLICHIVDQISDELAPFKVQPNVALQQQIISNGLKHLNLSEAAREAWFKNLSINKQQLIDVYFIIQRVARQSMELFLKNRKKIIGHSDFENLDRVLSRLIY